MAQGTRKRTSDISALAERIVDEAVAVAEEVGWGKLRLNAVAERLDVSLAEIHTHFRDLDAVADAWFGRALAAMLVPPPNFGDLPAAERTHIVMMRWFDALADHRRVSVDMIGTKLYPSHAHHWVPLIFNLSRLIQWVREAARLDAPGRQRQREEVALTLLFLRTLARWARDESAHQERTREFLRRRLASLERRIGLGRGGAGKGMT